MKYGKILVIAVNLAIISTAGYLYSNKIAADNALIQEMEAKKHELEVANDAKRVQLERQKEIVLSLMRLKAEKEEQIARIEAEKQAIIDANKSAEFKTQSECLAKNIYFEARNEGTQGQRAIAWVTLNRVASDKYPDTICDVVYQAKVDKKGNPFRDKCQFSWFCDGKGDKIRDMEAWDKALYIAADVMLKFGKETDPTGGATMYHADYVDPFWVDSFEKTVQINSHIFYEETRG